MNFREVFFQLSETEVVRIAGAPKRSFTYIMLSAHICEQITYHQHKRLPIAEVLLLPNEVSVHAPFCSNKCINQLRCIPLDKQYLIFLRFNLKPFQMQNIKARLSLHS